MSAETVMLWPVVHHDMMELFETMSFREKIRRVLSGLKQPKESGEHKWARLQVIRLSAPILAVIVPLAALVLVMIMPAGRRPRERYFSAVVRQEEVQTRLKEMPRVELEKREKPAVTDRANWEGFHETDAPPLGQEEAPTPEMTVGDCWREAAVWIRSPVMLKGLPPGQRTGKGREDGLKTWGAPPGTEDAVLRALRWLRQHQAPDGSWDAGAGGGRGPAGFGRTALTALGLLTFLAHGETPSSAEFGATVEKALRWLVMHQQPDGRWPEKDKGYGQGLAAYALAESYGVTQLPHLKKAATRAITVVVEGQHKSGGWNYDCGPPETRNDTSVMGWCAQALKAADMARLDEPRLRFAMMKSIEGFEGNFHRTAGSFGYTGPSGGSGLTGVGVLCLQLLGKPEAREVEAGLRVLESDVFDWQKATWKNVYYWYYNTQAKFHAGGDAWERWNARFADAMRQAQVVQEGAGLDGVDIGYWDTGNDRGGRVMDTTLCCLTLQVYYRYLPTYQKPEEIRYPEGSGGREVVPEEAGDITVKLVDQG